jgi:hypothetical protein
MLSFQYLFERFLLVEALTLPTCCVAEGDNWVVDGAPSIQAHITALMEHSQAVIRRRSVESKRRRDGLIRYAADVTSQNGEDGILRRLFELLPKAMPTCKHRWCVDVGAWDGVHLPVQWNGGEYSLKPTPKNLSASRIVIEARQTFATMLQYPSVKGRTVQVAPCTIYCCSNSNNKKTPSPMTSTFCALTLTATTTGSCTICGIHHNSAPWLYASSLIRPCPMIWFTSLHVMIVCDM